MRCEPHVSNLYLQRIFCTTFHDSTISQVGTLHMIVASDIIEALQRDWPHKSSIMGGACPGMGCVHCACFLKGAAKRERNNLYPSHNLE